MMIYTYLQILQQYNIDLNLCYLREMSLSFLEDESNLTFPCSLVLFPWTHSIYYIDSTLLFLVSASSFNPPALPASRALPSHLVLLSFLASAPLTPALAGRWLICAPGNLCPPAFFTCKASKTPENLSYLFLTQEQTKAQLLQQKSTKPPSNALSFTCR